VWTRLNQHDFGQLRVHCFPAWPSKISTKQALACINQPEPEWKCMQLVLSAVWHIHIQASLCMHAVQMYCSGSALDATSSKNGSGHNLIACAELNDLCCRFMFPQSCPLSDYVIMLSHERTCLCASMETAFSLFPMAHHWEMCKLLCQELLSHFHMIHTRASMHLWPPLEKNCR